MHADSYFFVGKTHSINQDYAKSGEGENGQQFIIVADGCSGSPDTDFGSRILSQVFANEVHNLLNFDSSLKEEEAFRLGGLAAAYQIKQLQLPANALDSTLLLAISMADKTRIRMIGDGVLATIDRNDDIEITEIEYPSGAPRYLHYWIDPDRHDLYKKEFGTKAIARTYILEKGEQQECTATETEFDSMIYTVALNPECFKAVVLFSDGVHSLQKPAETDTGRTFEAVPTRQTLQKLLAYKSYKGEFVKRRTKRFIKEMQKEGWVNNDDLSVAAIYLGE